jgi:hypothetical protein
MPRLEIDIIITVVLTVVLVALSYFMGLPSVYLKLQLNPIIMQIFGTLLGLSIASLGIVATLILNLPKKILEHDLMRIILHRFLILIIAEVLVLGLGFFIFLFSEEISLPLILLQVALSYFSFISTFYAGLYIYYIFKYVASHPRLETGAS